MQRDIERILIDQKHIAQRVQQVAARITADLDHVQPPEKVVMLPVLTGSMIFAADLMRQLPLPMQVNLIAVTGYPGKATQSQGAALREQLTDLPDSLAGCHVLIVDDILDSGQTLRLIRDLLQQRQPASVRICVLLRKDRPESRDISPDYVCFDIPDVFVVGYGLDFDGCYRNLPDIVTLRREVLGPSTPGPVSRLVPAEPTPSRTGQGSP